MKIERRVTKSPGIIQVTTEDERFYYKESEDRYVPSVTWISSFYPKGIAFYKWLADKGWAEAESLKVAAGDKGSKVHRAIENLLSGKEIKMTDKYVNFTTGLEEELSVEEYECILSFYDWYQEYKPKIIGFEQVIFDDHYGYAGTVDIIAEINGVKTIVDIKTSQSIWPEMELQVSAYSHTLNIDNRAILQVNYRLNKKKYKYTEVADKFNLFLAAKSIWQEEAGKQQPKQKDYPLSIKL